MYQIDSGKYYRVEIYQNGKSIGSHRNCKIKKLEPDMIILKTEFEDEVVYIGNTLSFRITDSSAHRNVHD